MKEDDQYKKYIGLHLRLRRQELGLFQDEVAERAGIDETTIGKIERGERTPLALPFSKSVLL
ncbi:helix-turn-helix domain-containing protein [Sutcliffiella halmapala]